MVVLSTFGIFWRAILILPERGFPILRRYCLKGVKVTFGALVKKTSYLRDRHVLCVVISPPCRLLKYGLFRKLNFVNSIFKTFVKLQISTHTNVNIQKYLHKYL